MQAATASIEIDITSAAIDGQLECCCEAELPALPDEVLIRKIEQYEADLRKSGVPLLDLPVKHYFSNGVCARELHIPAGTIITGKIHKFQNLNIMSKGDMTVLTEDGFKRVTAPFTIVSPPGTKRIAYAHKDTIWTTIFGTDIKDEDLIEDAFTVGSLDDYLKFVAEQTVQGG